MAPSRVAKPWIIAIGVLAIATSYKYYISRGNGRRIVDELGTKRRGKMWAVIGGGLYAEALFIPYVMAVYLTYFARLH